MAMQPSRGHAADLGTVALSRSSNAERESESVRVPTQEGPGVKGAAHFRSDLALQMKSSGRLGAPASCPLFPHTAFP